MRGAGPPSFPSSPPLTEEGEARVVDERVRERGVERQRERRRRHRREHRPTALEVLLEQLERHRRGQPGQEHARKGLGEDDRLGLLAQVPHDEAAEPPEQRDGDDRDGHDGDAALRHVADAREVARADGLRGERVDGVAQADEPREASRVAVHVSQRGRGESWESEGWEGGSASG